MMTTMAPTTGQVQGDDTPLARIQKFCRTASFETTHLTPAQLDEVKAMAIPGTAVYVAAIPSRPLSEQIETSAGLRERGFEPIPHLAARNFESAAAMETQLRQLVDKAGVTRALMIAGDRPEPAGTLPDALSGITSGVLQRCGIKEVGISGYPDGHPRITEAQLAAAMKDKFAAARDAGLKVRIVTQFSMSTQPFIDLLKRLRGDGINVPIGVGIAGPASMKTLLRFAAICGVKVSAQSAVRNVGLLKNLVSGSTSDPIVRALAVSNGFGDIYPHFFSFGGLPATVRWVMAAANGHIKLTKDGFESLK
jgi:methylenetetrahydrofolate reductase (NADPH)